MAVIILWFLGLVFWNLSAARLGGRSLSVAGLVRALAGAIFVVAALVLLYVSFPKMTQHEFSLYAIGTFLTALVADFLVGDDIRKRWGV